MHRIARIALGTAFAGPVATVAAAEVWCNCYTLTADGTLTLALEGTYTKDGSPIGVVWIGGGLLVGPGTSCDAGVVSGTPNDYHQYGVLWMDGMGNVTNLVWWKKWEQGDDGPAAPLLVGDGGVPVVDVMLNWDYQVDPLDPYVEIMIDAVLEYAGPYSSADLGALGLQVVGSNSDAPCCPEDLDHDGAVGFSDLLLILSHWGPCT